MEKSFKFSVLQADPDRRRGERVNVGIVVFLEDRLDVRMPELRKLTMLTGHKWDEIAEAYATQLTKGFDRNRSAQELLSGISFVSQIFEASEVGTLTVHSDAEDQDRVNSILQHLVKKPSLTKADKQQKINSEISKMLKRAEVLATKGQTIDDHKVVKRFIISPDKEIVADFAYKGKKLKIVSTLDMRGYKSSHSKACEKGATLYFAKETFGKNNVTPLGVFAVNPLEEKQHSSEIEILRSFADGNAFNWLNATERQKFASALY